jgi:hypothetical protein
VSHAADRPGRRLRPIASILLLVCLAGVVSGCRPAASGLGAHPTGASAETALQQVDDALAEADRVLARADEAFVEDP